TFLTLRNPVIPLCALVLATQGIFYNIFVFRCFLSYIVSPSTCHRFVGYLEEEAVVTYTRASGELEQGVVREAVNLAAPAIAKDYWRLSQNAAIKDVLYAVRSDGTTHRFCQSQHSSWQSSASSHDVNPFAIREPDMHVKGRNIKFTRETVAKYVNASEKLI
ncbi:alternative oxidase-domain-containing protein, partial [Russula earlei]